jgi:hypothetical protein
MAKHVYIYLYAYVYVYTYIQVYLSNYLLLYLFLFFLILGIYAAPETKDMAKHWNDFHPKGTFRLCVYVYIHIFIYIYKCICVSSPVLYIHTSIFD